jgi:hypothetical protein
MTGHLNIGKYRHEEIQLLMFEYLGRTRPMQDLMKILASDSFTFLCLFVCLTPKLTRPHAASVCLKNAHAGGMRVGLNAWLGLGQLLHIRDEVSPLYGVAVLNRSFTRAPDEFCFCDDKITKKFVFVVNLKLNALVLDLHRYREILDTYFHSLPPLVELCF